QHFRCVFTAAQGWGTFTQRRTSAVQENRLDLRWGKLTLRTLALAVPDESYASAEITWNGGPVTASVQRDGRTIRITFTQPLTLDRDDHLVVRAKAGPVGATPSSR